MKSFFRLVTLFFAAIIASFAAQAQVIHKESSTANHYVRKSKTPLPPARLNALSIQSGPCISEKTRIEVRRRIAGNKIRILRDDPQAFSAPKGGHPLFDWPIQAKEGFDEYGYYTVNFLVDHDPAFGAQQDYHCGSRSYDWPGGNHEGTDLILWPYPWKRMHEEVMEIVAAAPGVIVDKRDGNYDLNCSNDGNPNWNGIVIEHSDGSQAWYWHFKNGAITGKTIGETVAAGEYLGAAGSSGSSNTPHLHFEVYDADQNLIDPWTGACNDMNAATWWSDQQDYFVPRINHLSTHYTVLQSNDCPELETTYEQTEFAVGDSVIMRIYYRDLQNESTTHILLTAPDGTVYYDWDFVSPWPDYATASAHWYFLTDDTWQQGTYTITANFGGQTYQTEFALSDAVSTSVEQAEDFHLLPNPASDHIRITGYTEGGDYRIRDLTGRSVSAGSFAPSDEFNIDVAAYSPGIYFLILKGDRYSGVRRFVVSR